MTLNQICEAMGAVGDLGSRGGLRPARVRTDSRSTGKGDLFFCLVGENFDGHNFAAEAESKGAMAIVAATPLPEIERVPVLLVPDTVEGLGRLAGAWRRLSKARVVGVTGTAGKTTVKEMLARILSEAGTTARNEMNLNNLIGLPMSVLAATGKEDFWVMEAGISVPGEMDRLGDILRPDLAVIVNIGPGHLQGLGSLSGVAGQKARILRHMSPGGQGLVSLDYPELSEEATKIDPNVMGFTRRGWEAPFKGWYLGPGQEGKGRYRISLAGEEHELELSWRGGFAAENLIAAAAAAYLLGLDTETILAGLAKTEPSRQRFALRRAGNWTVIDDTYNANPLSMRRALEAASDLAGEGDLVLVLGEMRELGPEAEKAHHKLGLIAAGAGAKAIFWKGGEGWSVRQGLNEGGWSGDWAEIESADEFISLWKALGRVRGTVLFKGSRSNKMEIFSEALLRELENAV